ncbi:acetyl-CoA C-acetyltransferase [Paenibacillus montanisoli]|uniref:acetyl-CoA C-acetyltransferase n=1 Tax=Paenibacillus montanisoli TaxID=2081970 RepID=A0A328TZJ9_9BACL|nr:acetyl-CoA C-acetyltransferase [Paenibacillus montanisoli]RAP74953.1 acetyl-CoA C-acetyltransferase [Paenibacillus montanisoli]
MAELVIAGGARTAFGKFGGALKGMRAVQLGGIAIEGALGRGGIPPQAVDEVIMGMAVQAGAGQNPARQASLHAGIGNEVPAETINKVCASGMRALTMASQIIAAGDAELIVAGGMESMSQVPYALGEARFGLRLGDGRASDLLLRDGLTCAFAADTHMGDYADSIAAEHGISRQEQDEWALRSHERAVQSSMQGYFDAEIIPVPLQGAAPAKSHVFAFDKDEAPRGDTSAAKLAALKPVFAAGSSGTITAGNAPGLNDGAAALVVASKAKALREGYAAQAVLLGHASVSVEPRNYPIAPAFAVQKLLRQQGLDLAAVDRFEINEAFAVVVLACGKLAGWDADKVNVHGGAIALGHPVGASGARIVLTLINGLKRRGGGLGVAAICSGGGQGDAVLIRVDGNGG